jgi:hypothetical protein
LGPFQSSSQAPGFNGRLRDECLNGEIFFSLTDAREKLERWRADYNELRPHSSLDDRPPTEFAEQVQRSFALPIIDKAEPLSSQGSANAGQNPPAPDWTAVSPSDPGMRAKRLHEAPRLLAREN